ncbi:MAG: valine--tRNA ligase [Flavobacteriales bacterium]|nr:valine--tRNA ligase [Bacteroidota bacterium]MCB9239548.1 valine--tRNA ligase [Flavobacteriales bacterium]
MELTDKYEPSGFESHWYERWMNNGLFASTPDNRPPYTIVIPPPNVTGMLHMGHMLNNTIQDVMIRRARMQGFNACWVPGTDHASIATEAKVVAMLKEKGINKSDISREEFLEHAWEWKEKYGGIILKQLKKLGCSCDWDRTRFTMEDDLYASVIDVFVDLYNKGLIYKGARMVNWDPAGKTALSDEEVIYREVDSNLYYVQYQLVGSNDYIQIATTRPETILGDTAICVNPDDERYAHLKGAKAIVPIVNREVPIIFDSYVDIEYGTGALKVTPAHDINDYNLGVKHHVAAIDVFNEDGTMSDAAGHYIGMDRFAVRKKIAEDLKELGNLIKIEPIKNKVGFSERTNAMIEPRISQQWFMDMTKFMERNPEVLSDVMTDKIGIHPAKLKNTYRHWIENLKDWCISRQLIWGHRIPAYYLPNGQHVVARNEAEALEKAQAIDANLQLGDLTQDPDVLDTWFSSWLWPISVFNGILDPDNDDISYYYPTSLLVTGPDIIFFWVARMIMAGAEYQKEIPFSDVYFTGIVRDKQGRKMSKQLGNSPDPIDLMEKFGTDGVRMGLLMAAPAGNDLLFDESLCEQGRNFANKIWNAYRLISGWEAGDNDEAFYTGDVDHIHQWFETRLNEAISQIDDHYSKFRVSDAMLTTYKLIWGDFCSWYLEWLKPAYGSPLPQKDLAIVKANFDTLMRLLHPFMPFVSEHLWQQLNGENGEYINNQSWPTASDRTSSDLEIELAQDLISKVRAVRNGHGISPKIKADVTINTQKSSTYGALERIVDKLANVNSIQYGTDGQGQKELLGVDEVFIAFEGMQAEKKDSAQLEGELKRLEGFLFGINKKLENEKFLANAAEDVVERERQKQADTQLKIEAIKRELAQ